MITVYFLGGPWHGRQQVFADRPVRGVVRLDALDLDAMRQLLYSVSPNVHEHALDNLPLKHGVYERNRDLLEVYTADRKRNTLTLFWQGWGSE